jgi:hypothetical protein
MKKYFVKYLPITDKVLEKSNTLNIAFLCSKDIQVGDTVFLQNSYNYFATVIDKIGNSDRDIVLDEMPERRKNGTLDSREMIKIVGELSKDASWIKEGDEFDDNEIEEWYWHIEQNCLAISVKFAEEISNKPPNFHKNTWENNKSVFKRKIYKIKGPCGHFH